MTPRFSTHRVLACTAVAGLAALGTPAIATAAPQQDTASIITLQVENDAVSTLRGTSDQYYTSGLRLGFVSGTDAVPQHLADAANAIWGDGVSRFSLDIGQSIFTPRNTQTSNPSSTDRPYAGLLTLTGGLIHDTDTARTVVLVQAGAIGPDALGKEVQNGFHNIIGDTPNRGWNTQIHNRIVYEVTPSRTWRLPIAQAYGVSVDALPNVTVGVGNVRDYVQAGVIFRLGQGLGSDFGVARIQPGMTGTDAYTPTAPFVWYVFGGADGQAVGQDVTLPGGPNRVGPKWDVAEFELGAAAILYGVRVTYTQTWQTQEFHGQKGGLFNFGSLAASVRF